MADEEVDSSIGSDDAPLLDLANQAGRGNFLEKGSKQCPLTASTKREGMVLSSLLLQSCLKVQEEFKFVVLPQGGFKAAPLIKDIMANFLLFSSQDRLRHGALLAVPAQRARPHLRIQEGEEEERRQV